MVRVFSKRGGDNSGAYGEIQLPYLFGSGQYHVELGWRPSVAIVSFSREFEEKLKAVFELADDTPHEDPEIWVGYIDAYGDDTTPFDTTGFYVSYRNIPEFDGEALNLGLYFSYMALP